MQIDLNKIRVKPVYDYYERADVSSVLSRCHPLGDKKAIGKRISYVASYQGAWVAVAMFDKAVDRNKHRESAIGWSRIQQKERIKHVANNSRFAVIPKYAGIPNLASKVLSLITERISKDWLKQYGVPLLAVETYVDPEYHKNEGTCYKAAGWINLGMSSGYETTKGERTHGKWYFLKPLHKDSYKALSSDLPNALLSGIKLVSGESNNNYVLDASKIDLSQLQAELANIKDPRAAQGIRYPLVPFLSLCISAVVTGYTQYRQIADWISKLPSADRVRFGMPGDRSPSESIVSKFLRRIDPVELNTVLTKWLLKTYDQKKIKTISLDGKVLRATSSEPKEQLAFLNVYAHELGVVIAQLPTKKGGGEKAQAREVIENEQLIEGKTVLADALHTDQTIMKLLEKKTAITCSRSKVIKAISKNN